MTKKYLYMLIISIGISTIFLGCNTHTSNIDVHTQIMATISIDNTENSFLEFTLDNNYKNIDYIYFSSDEFDFFESHNFSLNEYENIPPTDIFMAQDNGQSVYVVQDVGNTITLYPDSIDSSVGIFLPSNYDLNNKYLNAKIVYSDGMIIERKMSFKYIDEAIILSMIEEETYEKTLF